MPSLARTTAGMRNVAYPSSPERNTVVVATCASERWRLEAVLERIDAKIAELRAVRRDVTKVMGACDRSACVFADGEIGA